MTTLIERLKDQRDRDAAEHCPAEIIALQDETIAAIESLQAENERLKDQFTRLKKMVDDGSIHERTYSAGLELERMNTKLRAERDALAAKLATLEADADRYRFIRARTSGHLNGLGAYFGWPGPLTVVAPRTILKGSVAEHLDKAIDSAKGGQHE